MPPPQLQPGPRLPRPLLEGLPLLLSPGCGVLVYPEVEAKVTWGSGASMKDGVQSQVPLTQQAYWQPRQRGLE